jgi:ATP-dependent Clp protease ATP-binding subunit ClpC
MEAKFSNRVKEVISLSREEALRLGHDYIGTEHLLLGMIREGEGVAVGLLKKLGVSLEELRTPPKVRRVVMSKTWPISH